MSRIRAGSGPALVGILLFGCGAATASEDGGTSRDGSVGLDGSVSRDGSMGRDGSVGRDGGSPPVEGCGGDFVGLGHEITAFAGVYTGRVHHGVVQRSANRLVAFGEQISPSLERLPYVQLDEEGGAVHVVEIEGEVPPGQIYHVIWHSGLDRFVLLMLELHPARYALYTMALDATTARFARLEATGTPPGEGLSFGELHGFGAGGLTTQRGDERYTIEVSGGSATWSAPVSVLGPSHGFEISDPTRDRVIAFGDYDFDSTTGETLLRPRVYTRSLPAGSWAEVPAFGGEALPTASDSSGVPEVYGAYDASVDRLFVALGRVVIEPGIGETWQRALWALDLGTGAWQVVVDPFFENHYSFDTAWAVDETNHRVLALAEGGLSVLHSDGPRLGQVEMLDLDGHLGPVKAQGATALADGRLVASTRYGRFVVFDPSDPAGRWERLGDVQLPRGTRYGLSIDRDPVTGDLLVFGGASSFGASATALLRRVSPDGSSVEEDSTPGAPPPRSDHSSLVHGETLYIVGGRDGSTYLDDVWALDLRARSWRRLATLSSGRARVALRFVGDELWVVGGRDGESGVRELVAIHPSEGTMRTVSVAGAWPARDGIFYGAVSFGGGLVLFDLVDNTIDGSIPRLFFLEPVGDGARWVDLGGCFVDRLVYEVLGVSVDEEHAYMVGPEVISLR